MPPGRPLLAPGLPSGTSFQSLALWPSNLLSHGARREFYQNKAQEEEDDEDEEDDEEIIQNRTRVRPDF